MIWKVVGVLILSFLGAGWLYESIASRVENLQKPEPLGRLVDLGGYRLHLQEQGEGPITVILDAGMTFPSLDWALVQPEVAKFARVVSYDRAGLGWSDPSPYPRDAEQIVSELHQLLENAQVPGPYVLVGHSMGGIHMRLFASRYPDEVVGLVLVDASHEEMNERLPPDPILDQNFFSRLIQKFLLNFGVQRLFLKSSALEQWFDELYAQYPEPIRSVYKKMQMNIQSMRAGMEENFYSDESLSQLKKYDGSLKDKPLIVITAGSLSFMNDRVGYPQSWIDETYRGWQILQKELVGLSSCGKQVIAVQSDHLIPRYQPELIVQAIRDVIEQESAIEAKISNAQSKESDGDFLRYQR